MGQEQGYVKLYRSLMNSQVWNELTPGQKVVMITLLMLVCWEPTKYNYYGTDIVVQPGQFICSQKQIENACGKGITRSTLSKLETLNFITIGQPLVNHESTNGQPLLNHESTTVPTKGKKLITIVNWRKYQHVDFEVTKESTTSKTELKH